MILQVACVIDDHSGILCEADHNDEVVASRQLGDRRGIDASGLNQRFAFTDQCIMLMQKRDESGRMQ
jgi:hypothetical protein